MKTVKVNELANGYLVELGNNKIGYVFKATEEFKVLEFIANELFGMKVTVSKK